jgi:branched-chain amino acid transport system substrate-binding protein
MRHPFGRYVGRVGLAVAVTAGVAIEVGVPTGGRAAASNSALTIAMVSSLTGPGSSQFSQSPAGFKARIALQNAQGGVNGHKIKGVVLDDGTSPTGITTAVQDAISKGAIGIVSVSPLFFLAAKYPNQQGIPVTGGFFDGPEWGTRPYDNMFAADAGSVNPKYPVNTAIGSFMKDHGGTVICSYGYSISPSSTRAALGTVDSFKHAGGKQGVLDTSIPFGGVDFTTAALVAKQNHCNAFFAGLVDNSNVALATALRTAGVHPKVVVFPTGYEPSIVKSPAWHNVQGGYFDSEFRPFQLPNAGTRQMQAALEKYEHFTSGEFPSYSQYESWLGADLMLKGIQVAGANPTHASVIDALRGLKSYNGSGLLPVSFNYSTNFGHDPAKACGWYMIAEQNGFVPSSSKPWCGTDLPNTTTVTAS